MEDIHALRMARVSSGCPWVTYMEKNRYGARRCPSNVRCNGTEGHFTPHYEDGFERTCSEGAPHTRQKYQA